MRTPNRNGSRQAVKIAEIEVLFASQRRCVEILCGMA